MNGPQNNNNGKGFIQNAYKGVKKFLKGADATLKKYKPVSLANKAADAVLGKDTKEKYLAMIPHATKLNKIALDHGYGKTPMHKYVTPKGAFLVYDTQVQNITPKKGYTAKVTTYKNKKTGKKSERISIVRAKTKGAKAAKNENLDIDKMTEKFAMKPAQI